MPHKLLLADDSVTIQRVIELTFADEDVQVIAVGNGQDAIDHVRREPPDIILADVGMPERSGYDVAAFVKADPATAHIPVVLLTGAFEPVDEARARAAGCDGVLVKPFEPQVVIGRVKDLLAGRRPSGMWSATPEAPPAAGGSPAELDTHPASRFDESSGDALEAYFDRLDAAFASSSTASPADPFVESAAPRPAEPASAPEPLSRPAADRAETGPRPSPLPVSLVDAFAALLAAERNIALNPSSVAPAPPPQHQPLTIPDEVIDSISDRVLARLTTESRLTILDVAERLVREEIERIKQAGS